MHYPALQGPRIPELDPILHYPADRMLPGPRSPRPRLRDSHFIPVACPNLCILDHVNYQVGGFA